MSESSKDKAYPEDDGRIAVSLKGETHFLSVNGTPLTRFYPGWVPFALHVSLLPTPVLRLRHDSGKEAYWLFDGGFNYRASRFVDLSASEQNLVVDTLVPYFQTLVRAALEAPYPEEIQLTEKVRNLGPKLNEALLARWLDRFAPPACCTPHMLPPEGLSFRPDTPPLKAASLIQLLTVAKGLASRTVPMILSPYGGNILRGYPVLRQPEMEFSRFADPAANIVLYIGTIKPDDRTEIPAIYCPQQDLILVAQETGLAAGIPLRLLSRFIDDPLYATNAPKELTVSVGPSGPLGAFNIGRASSLPTTPPSLPGHWPNQPPVSGGSASSSAGMTSGEGETPPSPEVPERPAPT